MDEIFQRKKRRRPFARIGGSFFAVLAVLSAVDALRAAPLPLGGDAHASGVEAVLYRVAAALFCGALAGWLLLPGAEGRRESGDRLLR